jgi:hypothetical protein
MTRQLTEELELNRPARGFRERIFRISLLFAPVGPGVAILLNSYLKKGPSEGFWYTTLSVVSWLFILWFFFAVSYAVTKFVRSEAVQILWWATIAFIGFFAVVKTVITFAR